MQTNQLKGVLIMLITVLIWGAMFPVAKGALQALDAFWMSSIRYGAAAPLCPPTALQAARRPLRVTRTGDSTADHPRPPRVPSFKLPFPGYQSSCPDSASVLKREQLVLGTVETVNTSVRNNGGFKERCDPAYCRHARLPGRAPTD